MNSAKSRVHYGWVVLVMGTLVVFGALGLARFGYSIVLPSMQTGLQFSTTEAGFLATVNLIGYLALSLIGGALASRFGPRVVITAGLAVAGAGMLLTGLAGSYAQAAVWRMVTGMGSGASNVPVMGLVAGWFAQQRRGTATGIAVAGSSLALIGTGVLVPPVLHEFGAAGWRVSWFIFSGVTFVLAALGYAFLRNRPSELGLAPLGTMGDEPALAVPSEKIRWGSVYRSWGVWHLGLVYVAFGFSYIIYMTFFVKSLMADGGYTQVEAGRLFMIMGWFSLVCGLIWGTVSDVVGRKWALVMVYLLHTVAFSMFALWSSPIGFTLSAILFGLSAWSIPAIMAAASGDILGPRLAPAGLGFITLFFGLGQALGPSIGGAVADAAGSLLPALLLAGGVALLGAVGAALLPHAKLLK